MKKLDLTTLGFRRTRCSQVLPSVGNLGGQMHILLGLIGARCSQVLPAAGDQKMKHLELITLGFIGARCSQVLPSVGDLGNTLYFWGS